MGSLLTTIGPLILFFVIFYFILIRPQQKRQKKTQEMQSNLQRGDKIVTIGGLHGTVDAVEDTQIVVKSNNTKLTYDRNAVREVVQKKENPHVNNEADEEDGKDKDDD